MGKTRKEEREEVRQNDSAEHRAILSLGRSELRSFATV